MSRGNLLFALIAITLTLEVEMSAADVSECTFWIEPIGKDEVYLDDFKIMLTNQTAQPIEIQHLDGPPFKLIYTYSQKAYPLVHKEDWYSAMRGASRPSSRRLIPAYLSTAFRIDLKGDYIIVNSGRAVPFRDFAVNKAGVITLIPTDGRVRPAESGLQSVQCQGASVVWKR